MIEAVALVYVVVQAYGLESALSYGAPGSFVAWVLFGQFTRGRNEDLEELTLRSPSPAAASATSGCLGDAGEGVDLAAMATPATPGVRRSVSGGTLEVFGEMREHASVNPWVNATWRVTAAERVKMALLAPWVLPARCAMIAAATVLAIVFANVATCGWDGTRPESLLQRVAERRHLRGLRATPEARRSARGARTIPDAAACSRTRSGCRGGASSSGRPCSGACASCSAASASGASTCGATSTTRRASSSATTCRWSNRRRSSSPRGARRP